MLTTRGFSKVGSTGEMRPPRCKMGWNRAAGDHPGDRGGDHAAMDAAIAQFGLLVGPEFGYSGVSQGRMGRPSGKCRFNMITDDQKTVEYNKKKVVLLTLGACAFVLIGVWMFSLDDAEIAAQRRKPFLVHGVGLLSILFFGGAGVLGIKNALMKRPALIFNSSGIQYNAAGFPTEVIPWSDIAGSALHEIRRQKMLVIRFKDPEKYIERGGALRRSLNAANYKICGSPVSIPAGTLTIGFDELQSLFGEYFRKYGSSGLAAGPTPVGMSADGRRP